MLAFLSSKPRTFAYHIYAYAAVGTRGGSKEAVWFLPKDYPDHHEYPQQGELYADSSS